MIFPSVYLLHVSPECSHHLSANEIPVPPDHLNGFLDANPLWCGCCHFKGCDEFPKDSDGSAKIALIAIDCSIAAWAVIQHSMADCEQEVIDILNFLEGLRQAVEKTFPGARSFIRPGFDEIEGPDKAGIAVIPG